VAIKYHYLSTDMLVR